MGLCLRLRAQGPDLGPPNKDPGPQGTVTDTKQAIQEVPARLDRPLQIEEPQKRVVIAEARGLDLAAKPARVRKRKQADMRELGHRLRLGFTLRSVVTTQDRSSGPRELRSTGGHIAVGSRLDIART